MADDEFHVRNNARVVGIFFLAGPFRRQKVAFAGGNRSCRGFWSSSRIVGHRGGTIAALDFYGHAPVATAMREADVLSSLAEDLGGLLLRFAVDQGTKRTRRCLLPMVAIVTAMMRVRMVVPGTVLV